MATINIIIKNQAKILNAFRQAPSLFIKRLDAGIYRAAGELKRLNTQAIRSNIGGFPPPKDRPGQTPLWRTGHMVQWTQPRKFGTLKAGIVTSPSTRYAIFVHEGTKFMSARPFFEATAKSGKKEIENLMNKIMNNIINEIARMTK